MIFKALLFLNFWFHRKATALEGEISYWLSLALRRVEQEWERKNRRKSERKIPNGKDKQREVYSWSNCRFRGNLICIYHLLNAIGQLDPNNFMYYQPSSLHYRYHSFRKKKIAIRKDSISYFPFFVFFFPSSIVPAVMWDPSSRASRAALFMCLKRSPPRRIPPNQRETITMTLVTSTIYQ